MDYKIPQSVIDNFVKVLTNKKEDGLFKYAIALGIYISTDIKQDQSPELEILDMSDRFLMLYRRTGIEDYLIISKILRKAAHRLYRQFSRIYSWKLSNKRFLNLVK